MRPRIIAAILFLAFATVAFAQSQPASPSPTPSSATELSPDQKAGIVEIISEARENSEMVAKRLESNAKRFDEVVLADTIDPVLEKRCVDGITAAIYDSTQFRLQAATQVVHQLTAEQRRYLKAEMAKPDSERGILEAVPKVFHLKVEDKDLASPNKSRDASPDPVNHNTVFRIHSIPPAATFAWRNQIVYPPVSLSRSRYHS